LGLLKLIDLSSNRLVGRIPKEFSSLKELIALNLSGNNLTGNIIQAIGEMKLLEVLDLSRNQLSGEIPRSLAMLTLLSVLDLSVNNLTGRIPTSTQLQSFDASKYAGNEQLCGLPLPNKCGYVVSSPVSDDKEDDD
jgi:EIX receptor 1/2